MKSRSLILPIIAVLCVGEAVAQTTISPNPLAGLPGQPGAHIAQIQALGDNQWLNLGAPAEDPTWGPALGCSWGGKSMVFAPALRGAFRTGEGWHAHVKPDGFGQDDYWFYDINGHRWICVYPGTDVQNFNQMVTDSLIYVDANGQPVDTGGQPIPGHLLIHAFGYISYDTDLNKFSMHRGGGFGRYYMPGLTTIEAGLTILEGQGLNKSGPKFAPWAYNTQTGKFERDLATNSSPAVGGYYPQYLYIPSKKAFFSAGVWGIAFFSPATRTWGPLVPNTANPEGWSLACYDSKRDRVYGGATAGDFYCYDVNSQVLTKIANGSACSPTLDNNRSALVYDSINDRVLLLAFVSSGDPCFGSGAVFPFDPATDTWGQPVPFDTAFSAHITNTNAAFYDPELGVVFIYTAGDSRDNGVMWAYCYKSKTTAVEGKARQSTQGRGVPVLTAAPNPCNPATFITVEDPALVSGRLTVYSTDGRKVFECEPGRRVQSRRVRVRFDGAALGPGVYFAVYRHGTAEVKRPFILVR